jgi:hypothetical protein
MRLVGRGLGPEAAESRAPNALADARVERTPEPTAPSLSVRYPWPPWFARPKAKLWAASGPPTLPKTAKVQCLRPLAAGDTTAQSVAFGVGDTGPSRLAANETFPFFARERSQAPWPSPPHLRGSQTVSCTRVPPHTSVQTCTSAHTAKHRLEPNNIGVHVPRWHEGSCPCRAISMRPSDSSSNQYKLNGSSMKVIAATRSFAAECQSTRLGARCASGRGFSAS